MKEKGIQIFAWYGAAAILAAYFFNSMKILDSGNLWYQIMNATGAVGILIASSRKKDYQPMVLNLIWAIIGLVAIIGIIVK